MDSPLAPSHASLRPRYRRLLTFGDLLDESIQLFRQHWVTYALVSAISLLPPGLILIWASASGTFTRPISLAELQSGTLAQSSASFQSQFIPVLATSLVSALFDLLWTAAIVVITDAYLRGADVSVGQVYRRALSRLAVLILGSLAYVVCLTVLTVLATGLFIVTGFGILGTLISVIALLVWWLRPGMLAHKGWVKWLIILTAPFGLPMYFAIQWSMLVVAVVLERRGPIAALARSSQLVDRQWWRVASILTVGSLIVAVLLYAPAALVDIPLTVGDASRGQFGLNPAEAAISNAVSVVLQILFASVGTIVYTLTFTDLRNRREGTDIVERLTQLEAALIPSNG